MFKKKSIRRNFLINMIFIVLFLVIAISSVTYITFINFYSNKIIAENDKTATFICSTVQNFIDGAYNISSEIVNNSDVVTMRTDKQNKVFTESVKRNNYLELIYAQRLDGKQTGRSSGELGDRSNRWWFKDIIKNPRSFVSKSYYSVNTKMPCTSIFMPINNNSGNMIGILGIDIKLEYIQSLIEKFSDNENYSFIIDGDGNVVAHPNKQYMEEVWNFKKQTKQISKKDTMGQSIIDANGDVITEEVSFDISDEYKNAINSVLQGDSGNTEIKLEGVDYYVSYCPVNIKGESDSWAVISLENKNIAMAAAHRIIFYVILISFFVLIISVILIEFSSKKITKPLEVMADITKNMSNGNLKSGIYYKGDNEIGTLAECLNNFIHNINGIISDIDYILTEVSEGNITAEPKNEYKGDFISIKNALCQITEFLNNIINKISLSADKVFEGASNLFKTSEILSNGATEQSNSIKSLSDTISEISQKVLNTAQNTYDAREKVTSVYSKIDDCNIMLKKVVNTMENVKKSSDGINNIIKTINEISSQTNFLSINASVEASRAGVFGTGFSIIAQDIKKLSDKSDLETKDSKKLLAQVKSAIDNSNLIINDTEKYLSEVLLETKGMSKIIEEIADASQEEVDFVMILMENIDKISNVVNANSSASLQSASEAKQLSAQAEGLKDIVGKFKLK